VVKICGLTRAKDICAAADMGAWAVGFVFAPSPRRLTGVRVTELIAEAREVRGARRDRGPLAVGVFGDASVEEIARTVESAGLDAVQLHGAPGPDASEVRRALAGWTPPMRLSSGEPAVPASILVIRAVAVNPEEDDREELRRRMVAARAGADLVLLDTSSGGRFGGTGTVFPWKLAREASDGRPFLVAGGIGPENVREALSQSGAWGVDVSSGVESSQGEKDARSMRDLVAEVNGIRGSSGAGGADALQEGSAK
jgi:phosphoribosylanthranilate isomerase